MEKTELEKALRAFERRLKALAKEMDVVLEAKRGERAVVLKPKEEPDFYFPPLPFWKKAASLSSPPSFPEKCGEGAGSKEKRFPSWR